jgi:hypothetical protein
MKIIITEEQIKKIINEQVYKSKTIINVDIQPEYESYITFNVNEWVKFINNNYKNNTIIFLYNGEDSLGMISENDYISWLNDLGIKEKVLNNSIFYDKGYAFFRYCIDNSINEKHIINLIQYLISNNINDTRDLEEHNWDDFMETYNIDDNEIRDLLERSDDMLNIPDLMDFLTKYNNIVLAGGGINECLKEVELALYALNKNFNILNQYTY